MILQILGLTILLLVCYTLIAIMIRYGIYPDWHRLIQGM